MKFVRVIDLLFEEKIGIAPNGTFWLYSKRENQRGWRKMHLLRGKNQDGWETEVVFKCKNRLLCLITMTVYDE